MKTDLFDYELPPERIAQTPSERRDGSRMMVLHRSTGRLEHRRISDITDYLREPDVLVLNNTKVIPARLFGHKVHSGGKIELLLLEEVEPGLWQVLLKASRRPKPGEPLMFCQGQMRAELVRDGDQGEALLRVQSDRPLLELLDEEGLPPLPPYISRKTASGEQLAIDRSRYQTIFASQPGAVAAPTAGLHFTAELLQQLSRQGVQQAEITLHVGVGTFRPVAVEDLREHTMHEERFSVGAEAADAMNMARARGGRIVAVGSTSVRTLESLETLSASEGRTCVFIYPPYTFRHVDAILTNFHLPKSTLLMMMSAFVGREALLEAYRVAVAEKYRFFSYGDCMLLV